MRPWACLTIGLLWIAVLPDLEAGKLFDKSARKQLTVWLNDDCQWLVSTNAKGEPTILGGAPVCPLVIDATITRALALGFELTKDNPQLLQESLRRSEVLVSLQKSVKTYKGNEGGYWLGTA